MLSTFTTVQQGRVKIHILPHTRFRTKDLTIRLHTPLSREQVTASALLPYMWMNGTTNRPTIREITMAADDLYGTVVRTSLGKKGPYQILEVAASMPDVSSFTDEDIASSAARLACEILLQHRPNEDAFRNAAIEQELNLHRRRIESARDDKMSFALERCMAEVAEQSAVALPRLGFLEDLSKLDGNALYKAYEDLLAKTEIHAYLVGPFDHPEALADVILETFVAGLPGVRTSEPIHVTALPRKEDGKRDNDNKFRFVREKQEVAQAQLDMGYRTGVNFAGEHYPSLLMMNGILGGFTHSKLFANVREKHSLAYTVWSHLDSMTGVLAIMTGIQPDKYQEAVDIIEAQLADILAGKITDDELEFTYRALENQYTLLQDQPSALATWHYNGLICGRDRNIDELMREIRSISKNDVMEAAKLLEPNTIYFLTGEGDAS